MAKTENTKGVWEKKPKHPNFISKGRFYMVRCFKCNRENYAFNVATGICTWCGHDESLPTQGGTDYEGSDNT